MRGTRFGLGSVGGAPKRHGVTIAASVIFHAAIAATVSWDGCRATVGAEPRQMARAPSASDVNAPGSIGVELPHGGDGLTERTLDPTGDPPLPIARAAIAQPDTGDAGR